MNKEDLTQYFGIALLISIVVCGTVFISAIGWYCINQLKPELPSIRLAIESLPPELYLATVAGTWLVLLLLLTYGYMLLSGDIE